MGKIKNYGFNFSKEQYQALVDVLCKNKTTPENIAFISGTAMHSIFFDSPRFSAVAEFFESSHEYNQGDLEVYFNLYRKTDTNSLKPTGFCLESFDIETIPKTYEKFCETVDKTIRAGCLRDVLEDYINECTKGLKLNARVVDDDGFKGRITAYHPIANMYKVEHDLIDGKRVATDGWYPPERIMVTPEEKQVSSIDDLISRATAISEQSKELADDLGKFKDGFEMTD